MQPALLARVVVALATAPLFAQQPPVPGTQPLQMEGDYSAQMVAGIGRYLEREATRATDERLRSWKGFEPSQAGAMRQKLRTTLGMSDAIQSGALESIGPLQLTATPQPSRVRHVRWPVYHDFTAEGVLLLPAGESRAIVIAVPDADQPPETFARAQKLADAGCTVLIPTLVDRRTMWSGSEHLAKFTNLPHREWLYRQAFEVGRTLLGYEVQTIAAALDALGCTPDTPAGIIGYGEGARTALHAAALDDRLRSTLVSGSFGPHQELWREPLDRNLFGYQRTFGDAELAALASPRSVFVEACDVPGFTSPPPVEKNQRAAAAPGQIRTLPLAAVQREIDRAREEKASISLVSTENAVANFLRPLGLTPGTPSEWKIPIDQAVIDARQYRLVRSLEQHTQRVLELSENTRYAADLWKKLAPGAEWTAIQAKARQDFWENVIGKLPTNYLPPNPRTRQVLDHEKWTGYDLVLDVHPDIFAWGTLLLPKDLKPGERRPVVVCQHGLEGLPFNTITEDQTSRAWASYKGYASRLAAQGFIVFAPHNPYRGGDAFRTLQRQAQPLGWSLFSVINAQHDVITKWLAEQPYVDPARIAFYGLSYGGKSAMRIPAVIDRYCLSICSGDFNEWVRKNAWTEYPGSYLYTNEYEIYEWDLAHTFNYAEMALLIEPRPFMVERGHKDGVASSEWVGYEFAKVLRGYTQRGVGDRAEIEWFDGPHTINGQGTFRFLHRHLRWPEPGK